MLSVNKVSNGLGEAVAWAILEDKMRVVAEFKKIEEACAFADAYSPYQKEITMTFTSTAPGFQAKINAIAKTSGMTGEAVYDLWLKYDKQCTNYDQSPVLFEFVQWYASDLGGNERALMDALDQVEAVL